MKTTLFALAAAAVFACGAASAETYTVPLPSLLGNYHYSTQRTASVDLGTCFLTITQARIQCSGTLTPGIGMGDGVEMPPGFFEWPAMMTFQMEGMDPNWPWVSGWNACTPEHNGSFTADISFSTSPVPKWRSLLDGQVDLQAHLTWIFVIGGTMLSSPTGSLTSAALFVEGTPCGSYPGDANKDGFVDVGDLGVLGDNYGKHDPNSNRATWEEADFNGDGAVDIGDLGILGAYYGTAVPGGGLTPLPEPATLAVLALGALALLRRRDI